MELALPVSLIRPDRVLWLFGMGLCAESPGGGSRPASSRSAKASNGPGTLSPAALGSRVTMSPASKAPRRNPSLHTLLRIAPAPGVPLLHPLFTGRNPPPGQKS